MVAVSVGKVYMTHHLEQYRVLRTSPGGSVSCSSHAHPSLSLVLPKNQGHPGTRYGVMLACAASIDVLSFCSNLQQPSSDFVTQCTCPPDIDANLKAGLNKLS